MKILKKIYISLIFIFLYAPIFVLIIFSFNNSKSRVVWSGFTFEWYTRLFANQEILTATYNTLIIAFISALISTILGTIAAIGISKSSKRLRDFTISVTNLPMINPEIVTGVSMMILFVSFYNLTGLLEPGIVTLIVAHTTFCLPFVVLSVLPKLKQLDVTLYEAAKDLGCTGLGAFFKVIWPQIMPGIITGSIMSFTMSIDDFVISYFAGATTQTLPIVIYSMTRRRISPEINALSTVLFAIVLTLLIIINLRKQGPKEENKNKW